MLRISSLAPVVLSGLLINVIAYVIPPPRSTEWNLRNTPSPYALHYSVLQDMFQQQTRDSREPGVYSPSTLKRSLSMGLGKRDNNWSEDMVQPSFSNIYALSKRSGHSGMGKRGNDWADEIFQPSYNSIYSPSKRSGHGGMGKRDNLWNEDEEIYQPSYDNIYSLDKRSGHGGMGKRSDGIYLQPSFDNMSSSRLAEVALRVRDMSRILRLWQKRSGPLSNGMGK